MRKFKSNQRLRERKEKDDRFATNCVKIRSEPKTINWAIAGLFQSILPARQILLQNESLATKSRALQLLNIALRAPGMEIRLLSLKRPCRNRSPHARHQVLIVVQIVPGQQHARNHLLGAEHVV